MLFRYQNIVEGKGVLTWFDVVKGWIHIEGVFVVFYLFAVRSVGLVFPLFFFLDSMFRVYCCYKIACAEILYVCSQVWSQVMLQQYNSIDSEVLYGIII